MPTTYKNLFQSSPAATTATLAYTCPTATSAVTSTLTICNQNTTGVDVRVWFVRAADIAGYAGPTAKMYVYYDLNIPAKGTFRATCGDCFQATERVYVYSSATNVSFTMDGQEIT